MRTTTKMAAAAVGTGFVVRQVRRSRVRVPAVDGQEGPKNRWRAVTVNKPLDQVAPNGSLPLPLAELGELVEVRTSAAPDGKGTEIAARLRSPESSGLGALPDRLAGRDLRQAVRSALRESKALLEVGVVLRVDPRPHGERTAAPSGKLLDAVTGRAYGEGVW